MNSSMMYYLIYKTNTMKSNLFFDFTVDKEAAKAYVTREFNAPLILVWKAWTDPAILDQWWAPKPYKTVTKSQKFEEGGTWLYSMVGPSGDKHWCKSEYITIDIENLIEWLDAFCDENGKTNSSAPSTHWNIDFQQTDDKTRVNVTLNFDRLEDLEQILKMGFREGFTAALGNLDEVVENLQ